MNETKQWTEPTGTPWSVATFGGQVEVIQDASKSICSLARGNALANAAHIVRAVNAFDDLVGFCEEIVSSKGYVGQAWLLGRATHLLSQCDQAALAKAEGGGA